MKREKIPMKGLLWLFFVSFLVYAIYFNCFGTNAETAMTFLKIDESGLGVIMTAQSVGGVIMTVLLGLFGERINKIYGVAAGLGLMGAGAVLIGLIPIFCEEGQGYGLLLIFSFLAGLGALTVDLLMNGVITDLYPEKKNTLLPYVHAFYGMGAMAAPMFVTMLASPDRPTSFGQPYFAVGIIALCITGLLCISGRKYTPETPYRDMTDWRERVTENPAEVFRDKRAWFYLLCCFLYLCFQSGLTAWLPQFCMHELGFAYHDSAMLATLYFLGALAMRLLAPVIFRRITVKNFYVITISASAVLLALFLVWHPELWAARILIAAIGFLQGASVPALVILCSDAFPGRSASASSVIVLGVSLAAMAAPSVMGLIIRAQSYMGAMVLILACLPCSIPVLVAVSRMKKKEK